MNAKLANQIMQEVKKLLPQYSYTIRYWQIGSESEDAAGFDSDDVFCFTIREDRRNKKWNIHMYVNNEYRDVVWKTNYEKLKTETKQSFNKTPAEYAKAIVKLLTPALPEFEKMKQYINENENLLNQAIVTYDTIAKHIGNNTPARLKACDEVIYTNKATVRITQSNHISLTVSSLTLEQTLKILDVLEPRK